MANEQPPVVDREQTAPCCAHDGSVMKLVRSSPKVGAFPELLSYRCDRCGAVETVEALEPHATHSS